MTTEKSTANRNLGAGGTALRWAVVLVALPLLLAAFPAPANGLGPTGCTSLLINGSFENPVVSDVSEDFSEIGGQDVPGWVREAGDATEIQRNLGGAAADGSQWLELAASQPTRLSQSPVGAVPGALYELRFAYSARPGSQFAGDNRFRVTWGSASEPLQIEQAVGTTTWQYASLVAEAPADGGGKVTFQDLSGGDSGAAMLIDDVTLCRRVPGLAQKCCCGGNEVYAFTPYPHLSWALAQNGNLLRLWWDQVNQQEEVSYTGFDRPLVSGSLRRDPFGDGVLALSDRGDIVRAVELGGSWTTELVLPSRVARLGGVRSCALITTFGGSFHGIYVVTNAVILRIYQDFPGGPWRFDSVRIGKQLAARIVPTSLHETLDGRVNGVLDDGQRWFVWFEDNDPSKMRFDFEAGDVIAVPPVADCAE